MPRYHFNIAHHRHEPDVDGTQCDSLEAARVEAIVFAGACLRDNPDLVGNGQAFKVEVTDAEQVLRFTVIVDTVDTG